MEGFCYLLNPWVAASSSWTGRAKWFSLLARRHKRRRPKTKWSSPTCFELKILRKREITTGVAKFASCCLIRRGSFMGTRTHRHGSNILARLSSGGGVARLLSRGVPPTKYVSAAGLGTRPTQEKGAPRSRGSFCCCTHIQKYTIVRPPTRECCSSTGFFHRTWDSTTRGAGCHCAG